MAYGPVPSSRGRGRASPGRHVPGGDHRLAVLGAQRVQGRRLELEKAPGPGLQPQPAGGQHAQQVTMGDERDVAVGQQRAHPCQYRVGSGADLGERLPGVGGVAGDDPVPPQVPARA